MEKKLLIDEVNIKPLAFQAIVVATDEKGNFIIENGAVVRKQVTSDIDPEALGKINEILVEQYNKHLK